MLYEHFTSYSISVYYSVYGVVSHPRKYYGSSIDTIDYVHGIGNRNDSAHVTIKIIKIIPVRTVRSLRIESVAF